MPYASEVNKSSQPRPIVVNQKLIEPFVKFSHELPLLDGEKPALLRFVPDGIENIVKEFAPTVELGRRLRREAAVGWGSLIVQPRNQLA